MPVVGFWISRSGTMGVSMNSSGELATERGVLEYERIENTIRITGYRGKDTVVEVPAIMDGCPVTCIGKKAFLSNKMVKQISLPESILRIEDWAFAFCSKLSKILLPYHSITAWRSDRSFSRIVRRWCRSSMSMAMKRIPEQKISPICWRLL